MREQRFAIGLLRDGAARMTCVNAGCENERNGWAIVLDPTDPKGVKAAEFVEQDGGRRYIKLRSQEAGEWFVGHGHTEGLEFSPMMRSLIGRTPPDMLIFLFPPGQQCFVRHLDREVLFKAQRVVPGRGGGMVVAETRIHQRPQDFTEHMNEEGERYNQLVHRG